MMRLLQRGKSCLPPARDLRYREAFLGALLREMNR
jgi:hypothetical protein